MSQRLLFAPGSQELSWQLLCHWRESRVWAASHPALPLTHGSTGLERRTRLYYIHSSSLQKRQSRAEPSSSRGTRRSSGPGSGASSSGGEGGPAAGRGSGRSGLVGVVHVVHVALLVLRHLRQSPLSPPGRAAGRQRHLVPPAPLPPRAPSPPSKRRPRSSSRPPRPPRWAASGCPLQGGGQGGGQGPWGMQEGCGWFSQGGKCSSGTALGAVPPGCIRLWTAAHGCLCFSCRLAQPSPVRAPLRLTHDGSPNKCHQQRHHNAGRLEPALDTGCPLLVHAREVKRLDEPAEGRNGDDCPWRRHSLAPEDPYFPAFLGTLP